MYINASLIQSQLVLFGKTSTMATKVGGSPKDVFDMQINSVGKVELDDNPFQFDTGRRDKSYAAWYATSKNYEASARANESNSIVDQLGDTMIGGSTVDDVLDGLGNLTGANNASSDPDRSAGTNDAPDTSGSTAGSSGTGSTGTSSTGSTGGGGLLGGRLIRGLL